MSSTGRSEAASAPTQSSEIHSARQLRAVASVVAAADEMAASRSWSAPSAGLRRAVDALAARLRGFLACRELSRIDAEACQCVARLIEAGELLPAADLLRVACTGLSQAEADQVVGLLCGAQTDGGEAEWYDPFEWLPYTLALLFLDGLDFEGEDQADKLEVFGLRLAESFPPAQALDLARRAAAVLAASGKNYPGRRWMSACIYFGLYKYYCSRRDVAALEEAADLLAATPVVSLESVLDLSALPQPNPARAAEKFERGTQLACDGDLQGAAEAFRVAASLQPDYHPALFCLGLALIGLNHMHMLIYTEVGPPLRSLKAMHLAVDCRAEAAGVDPWVMDFCAAFARQQQGAVWTVCDERSDTDAPWIALSFIAEYTGDLAAAGRNLQRALEKVRYPDRCAMILRAMQRLGIATATATPDASAAQAPAGFVQFDRVLGNWGGYGVFYPGTVQGRADGGYMIHFDDGDAAVLQEEDLRPEDVAPGQRVRVDVEGNRHYTLGTITARVGDRVTVRLDETGEEKQVPVARVGVLGTGSPPIEIGTGKRQLYPIRDLEQGRQLYESALDAAAKGDLASAVAQLEQSASALPDALTFYCLGCYLQLAGRFEEAQDAYYDCLRMNPLFHYALGNVASVLLALGETDKACDCAAALAHQCRDDAAAQTVAAKIMRGTRPKDALALADRALKLMPSLVPAYELRQALAPPGEGETAAGPRLIPPADVGDVREDWVEKLPCPCLRRGSAGMVCMARKHVPEARVDPADPDKCRRPGYLACEYLRDGMFSSLMMGPIPHIQRLLDRGHAARDAHRDADALAFYQAAVGAEPFLWGAYLSIAAMLRRLGRPREAYASGVRCLDLSRLFGGEWGMHGAAVPRLLGAAAGDLEEFQTAASHYRAACRIDPSDVSSWNSLAVVLRSLGEHGAAVDVLREAVRRKVADAETYRMLSLSLAWMGELAEAEQAAQTASSMAPDDAAYAYHGEYRRHIEAAQAFAEKARRWLDANPEVRDNPEQAADPNALLMALLNWGALRQKHHAWRPLAALRDRFPGSIQAQVAEAIFIAAFRRKESELPKAVALLEPLVAAGGLADEWMGIVTTQLSRCYFLLREYQRAREIVEGWLRKYPEDEGMWGFLTQICEILNCPGDVAALRKALGRDRRPDTGTIIFKLGLVPLAVVATLVVLPLPLFIRLAFAAGAVAAMAIYLPRWAQPPELPQRNENAATVAALVAAGGAFLLSAAILVRSVLFCCLDPVLWAAVAAIPAMIYRFQGKR